MDKTVPASAAILLDFIGNIKRRRVGQVHGNNHGLPRRVALGHFSRAYFRCHSVVAVPFQNLSCFLQRDGVAAGQREKLERLCCCSASAWHDESYDGWGKWLLIAPMRLLRELHNLQRRIVSSTWPLCSRYSGREPHMSDDFTPYALIADDDAIVRMHAADILAEAGFRVNEASGVDEALAILRAAGESIQLLFTDVHMPPGEFNGFYLARECAKGWPHIGILVASGIAQPQDEDLPPGAHFVKKPFSAEVVYDRLNEILPDGKKPEPLRKRPA